MLDVHVSKERLSKLLGGGEGEVAEMSLRVIKHIGGTSSTEVPKAQLAAGCENTQRYVTQESSLQS